MELFIIGFMMGMMLSIFAALMHCAYWFETVHPEEDYWHRRRQSRKSGAVQESLHPSDRCGLLKEAPELEVADGAER